MMSLTFLTAHEFKKVKTKYAKEGWDAVYYMVMVFEDILKPGVLKVQ